MWKLALGIVGAFGVASAANGAVAYTNEADFVNQLQPGYYLEEFDGYTYGSYVDLTLDLAQGPWSYTLGAAGGGSNQLFSGDGNMSTDSALDALTVTFTGADVYAVGGFFFAGDFSGFYQVGPIELSLSDGTFYSFDPASDSEFVGFVSNVPITSMSIEAPDVTGNAWPTIDHFYVGTTVIPGPGALALLGVAGLAGSRRRR